MCPKGNTRSGAMSWFAFCKKRSTEGMGGRWTEPPARRVASSYFHKHLGYEAFFPSPSYNIHQHPLHQKCLSKSLKQPKMALARQPVLGLSKLPSTQLHFSRHLEESLRYQPQALVPQQVTIHSAAHRGDGKHWCFLSGYIQCYDTALCSKTDSVSAFCVSDS